MSPAHRTSVGLAALLAATAACGGPPAWPSVQPADLTATQTAQLARADTAQNQLAAQLLAELQAALAAGDAAAAIDVCRRRAPAIAAEVGAAARLRLGRTSTLLRNPANAAPAWATAHIAANQGDPATLVGPDGELGTLRPILTMPLCTQCHGKADAMDPGVRVALQQHYPQDRATGYAPGDLRGWFWVEVPRPQ